MRVMCCAVLRCFCSNAFEVCKILNEKMHKNLVVIFEISKRLDNFYLYAFSFDLKYNRYFLTKQKQSQEILLQFCIIAQTILKIQELKRNHKCINDFSVMSLPRFYLLCCGKKATSTRKRTAK